MNLKNRLYGILVNRKPGISARYHRFHDGAFGAEKFVSWLYLLWLNFAYYILFVKSLGDIPESKPYESGKLPVTNSESFLNHEEFNNKEPLSVSHYVDRLKDYDVCSFDIFDTLIFRPFLKPTDLFYLLGDQSDILDFRNIRIKAERDARQKSLQNYGHTEITLDDIYRQIEDNLGLFTASIKHKEIQLETSLCYANPFMLEVWNKLLKMKKRLIVVSDMYLPGYVLKAILEKNGFSGYERLYVSCEHQKSKANGELFKLVKDDYKESSIIHIGDNAKSDYKMAKANGIDSLLYPRPDRKSKDYRPFDMSPIIGGAYRGLVTNHIYNGLDTFSMEYEYGYIYGGLFVLGYCSFIHSFCVTNNIDKLLFLSRDGDILKQVYDFIYPEESYKTEYAYWSRKAGTTLMAKADKSDYFRRFIDHKVNSGYTIEKILCAMNLKSFIKDSGNLAKEILTDGNKRALYDFIESRWDEILSVYESEHQNAEKYYHSILIGAKNAVIIDIGWAGSGPMALSYLAGKEWNIPCKITGIIAGTNTIYNDESDASEPFLQSGKLVSYLYSQRHNRDLLKKHNPNKDYNVYWELLLSSPTPQFNGFSDKNPEKSGENDIYMKDLDITLRFGKYDKNPEGIKEIQRGILDFAKHYREHFKDYPFMFNISGRDAYAPMLLAASHNEKYLKTIEKRFKLNINVD